MILDNISFLYCTCDGYDDLWIIYFKHLKKYWPEMSCPIYLCTEQKKFTYDGYDIRCPLSKVSVDKSCWSKRLIMLLKQVPEEYIIFTLDDFVITQRVNHDVVAKSVELMKEKSDVGYICFHQELTANSNEERKHNALPAEIPELHLCKKGMPYRITTQVGLWRKSYLLKLLKAHESAWQFEVRANLRANIYYNRTKIYDVNNPVVEYPSGGIVWRGKVLDAHISLFDPEDINPIVEKRGVVTRVEHNKGTGVRKKKFKDYWNYVLSYLPF